MNEYVFKVIIGSADCGTITMKGKTEEEAYSKAQDYVSKGLAKGLPELDVPFNIEIE